MTDTSMTEYTTTRLQHDLYRDKPMRTNLPPPLRSVAWLVSQHSLRPIRYPHLPGTGAETAEMD